MILNVHVQAVYYNNLCNFELTPLTYHYNISWNSVAADLFLISVSLAQVELPGAATIRGRLSKYYSGKYGI